MNAVEILEKARAILDPGDGSCYWGQGRFRKEDGDGKTCYCTVGAIVKAFDPLMTIVTCSIDDLLNSDFGGEIIEAFKEGAEIPDITFLSDIYHWNDNPERTSEEIITAFDDAINYLKESQ